MKISAKLALSFLLPAIVLTGCSKKADTNKPIEQVEAEAQKMTLNDLQSTAQAYAKEITAKKSDAQKVTDQIKTISPTELFGEKAKSLKSEMEKVGAEVNALSQRYEIYLKKYQELGGDLSKVQVQ